MERTIKFRAWLDGEHKEYGGSTLKAEPHMEYDVCVNGNGHYIWVDGFNGDRIRGAYATVPLMQFTGLTDRNGKEVYEGDILRFYTGGTTTDANGTRPSYIDFPVEWHDGYTGTGEYDDDILFGWRFPHSHEECEVIGNIYENPELLNTLKPNV